MHVPKEIIIVVLAIQVVSSESEGLPGILGGIENVANSATTFRK